MNHQERATRKHYISEIEENAERHSDTAPNRAIVEGLLAVSQRLDLLERTIHDAIAGEAILVYREGMVDPKDLPEGMEAVPVMGPVDQALAVYRELRKDDED